MSLQNGTAGVISIVNSTITGNTAGSEGGGARIVYGDMQLSSSIIAGNTSGDQRDINGLRHLGRGPDTIIAHHSLIGVGDTGVMTLTPGNLTGTKAAPLDAKLGPLTDNGGPTMTHALLPGSPAINAGNNLGGYEFDQRGAGYSRTVGPSTDIGAFEVQPIAPPPAGISLVTVNDGANQRSRVTSLVVSFDTPPSLPGSPADAFQLKRQSDNAVVSLATSVSGNNVTLTFTGGPVESGSLADGRYTLTVLASQIANLDGNSDGTPGDDYVLVGTPANGLFRLFGDADGNGQVGVNDFLAFRLAFLSPNPVFDFNSSGAVDASDFIQFRLRFLQTV